MKAWRYFYRCTQQKRIGHKNKLKHEQSSNINRSIGMRNKNQISIDVTVRQHPASRNHWLCIVTTRRGLCYYVTHAGASSPCEDDVRNWWKNERHKFEPYYI